MSISVEKLQEGVVKKSNQQENQAQSARKEERESKNERLSEYWKARKIFLRAEIAFVRFGKRKDQEKRQRGKKEE